MKFPKRQPGIGYIDSWLWLPKSHVSGQMIESSFFFESGGKSIEAWQEERHHYKVPRNFLHQQTLPKLPYPIYDTRPQTYPYVKFNSKVVLDSREVGKTYQTEGSAALLATTDGILCLRCGAGKTVVALHSAVQLSGPILITVTDAGLQEQWVEEIELHLGIPASEVGIIGGGKFEWKKSIVVAQVNTLARRAENDQLPPEMLSYFAVIISDEAHVMGAPYFNSAIPPFFGRRWGLTATPEREDGFDVLLKYTMGNVVYSYLTPDLKPKFVFYQLPTKLDPNSREDFESTHDKTGEFHFGMTFGYLARKNKDDRTTRIVVEIKKALAVGREVLVLAHSKEMTEILGQCFPNAGVVNGDVKGAERSRRIRECNPVIAIMTLGKQALNKPRLDTLFIVEPFSKKGILQQTMGRILRRFTGKKEPLVVVFEDIFVRPLTLLCGKIRMLLHRWPESKGGAVPYTIVKLKAP